MSDFVLTFFYWGLPSIAFVLSLSLLVILLLSKKDALIKSFIFIVLCVGVWSASSLLMKLESYPGTLFYNRLMIAGSAVLPFAAYIFLNVYIDRKRWMSLITWGVLEVFMMGLLVMGYVTTDARMIPISHAPYTELEYTLSWGAYVSYGIIFILLIACFVITFTHIKKSISITKGLKSIVASLFIIFIGMGINLVPVIGKFPFDFFAGSIALLIMMKAVYANRVFELKIVITKALVLTAVLVGLSISTSFLLNRAWSIFHAMNSGIDDSVILVVAIVLGILVFQPIFGFIHNLVNKFFYKDEIKREAEIHNFTQSVANNLNAKEISEELIKVSYSVLNHGKLYLYLKDDVQEKFDLYASSKKLERKKIEFSLNHSFVKWFEVEDKPIYGDDLYHHPLFKSMWEEDLNALDELLFEVAIPLKVHHDLIGFMLICHNDHRSIEAFNHIESIELMASTAAMALTNALLFEKTQTEAITDSLTQTYNHRYFMEAIQTSVEAKPITLSLVLFGIDSLTVYNDIYGHLAGDTVLIKIADRIKRSVNDATIVFRYAGDIFGVLLNNADTKQSYDLAEKIRSQIETLSVSNINETERNVTVSVGLCVYPSASSDAVSLLKNANTALIYSKRNGRNRTSIYNPTVAEAPVSEFSLSEDQWATIYALTATIDAKDHITFGHSQRVSKYATAIAQANGATESEIEIIRQASLLHDIGKIGIPENILTKTTRLTSDEFDVMKRHVDLSVTIIKYLPTFNKVIPSVIGHHERYDGKGYPRGLKEENIPFGARCIAIADAFDAITSDRHYKTNHTIDYAIEEMRRNAGGQFDPHLVEIFIRLINQGDVMIEPTRSAQIDVELRA